MDARFHSFDLWRKREAKGSIRNLRSEPAKKTRKSPGFACQRPARYRPLVSVVNYSQPRSIFKARERKDERSECKVRGAHGGGEASEASELASSSLTILSARSVME